MNTLKTGQFMQDEFDAFKRFQLFVQKCPLHIMDDIFDITRICASLADSAQTRHPIHPAGLLAESPRLTPPGETDLRSRRSVISNERTGQDHQHGRSHLAQLNRESEKDKNRLPRLADLGDSGQIERDADVVGLLHRDRNGDDPNKTILLVAKQRDGETGLVQLRYEPQYCQFTDPDEA